MHVIEVTKPDGTHTPQEVVIPRCNLAVAGDLLIGAIQTAFGGRGDGKVIEAFDYAAAAIARAEEQRRGYGGIVLRAQMNPALLEELMAALLPKGSEWERDVQRMTPDSYREYLWEDSIGLEPIACSASGVPIHPVVSGKYPTYLLADISIQAQEPLGTGL